MSRFFALLFVFSLLVLPAAYAAGPPISGDMVKLTAYDPPAYLSPVMISSSGEGLTYLSEFEGKLIILNIWATWCPPCIKELPSLNALQYAMGSDTFEVVTVSVDTTGPEVVKKYMDDNGLKALKPYIDLNKNLQQQEVLSGVAGIPVTLIIDPKGKLLARVAGDADWNGPAARAVIEYYLKNVTF